MPNISDAELYEKILTHFNANSIKISRLQKNIIHGLVLSFREKLKERRRFLEEQFFKGA
jgi:hypothetical protein